MIMVYLYWLKGTIKFQDLAASIDEEDVAKFTTVVKEFERATPLVYFCVKKNWILFLVMSCNLSIRKSNITRQSSMSAVNY